MLLLLLACLTSPSDYKDMLARASDFDGDGVLTDELDCEDCVDCDDDDPDIYPGAD